MGSAPASLLDWLHLEKNLFSFPEALFKMENANSITVKRNEFLIIFPMISFGKSKEITLKKHSKVLF